MVIAETGNTQSQKPIGNYSAYGKVVYIGEPDLNSSVENIFKDVIPVAIWTENGFLRVVATEGLNVASVSVYSTSGMLASFNSYDLNNLPSGIYIARVELEDGRVATAKIAL